MIEQFNQLLQFAKDNYKPTIIVVLFITVFAIAVNNAYIVEPLINANIEEYKSKQDVINAETAKDIQHIKEKVDDIYNSTKEIEKYLINNRRND